MLRRRAAIVLVTVCTGCAASIPPVPLTAFVNGDLEPVRAYYDEQLADGDENSGALFLNGLAQIEMLEGEADAARRHFRAAGSVMGNWQTSGSEVAAALIGSESSKTWKGDPHEKAMNAFYTGILYWQYGEPDNGRAAFKQGILADAESDEGDSQIDFALLYWLAGRASLAMGLSEDALSYFDEARQARRFAVKHGARGPSSHRLLERPAAGNLICLVDLGLGPEKVAAGSRDSLAVVQPRRPTVVSAEFELDGESLGRTELMADVVYQARTRGGKVMEGIREGKAVFKNVTEVGGIVLISEGLNDRGSGRRDKLIVGGALLALSLLTRPEADVRHWTTLPDTVHALTADVPAGTHDLTVRFLDGGGNELGHLRQNWTIEVPERGDAIYHFRSLPGLDQRRTIES